MAETDTPQQADYPDDPWDAQIRALDEAIATVEKCLKEADAGIDMLIAKRGEIANHVQHLWNRRHTLKEQIDEIRRSQNNRFYR